MEIKTVPTKFGEMKIYADDYYVGRSLELYGEYSHDEVELFRKIVKPGWIVVDAGANIGALTLPLAAMVGPLGMVYAIEPQPENRALLEQNCPHEVITVVEAALGDCDGNIMVPSLASSPYKNYGDVRVGDGEHEVELQKLDTLVDGMRIDFIKIDVEGYEEKVIAGAEETIERCRPILYVEIPKNREQDLLRLLWRLDYKVWGHSPPVGDAWPNVVNFNVLAIPKEKTDNYRDVTAPLTLKARPASHADKWACLCRFGSIGDDLIAASVLRPLKAQGYRTEVITCKPSHVVYENNPFIDKLTIKNTERDLPKNNQLEWNNWFRARSGEYDKFANLSHTCEASLALLPVQTQYWWPEKIRRKLCGHNYLEFVHDVFDMPHTFGPLFFPTEEEKEAALDTRKRLGSGKIVGWCLNGSRVDKVWPQAPMGVARTIKELGVQVVMFGGPPPRNDHQFAAQIQEHCKNQNGSDAGLHEAISPTADSDAWSIRRSLTMASVCDLVVGPDTGVMWGVAFEPVPKVVLHSHASVANIAKHWINTTSLHADQAKVPCWPCHMLHDNIETCQEVQERSGIKVDYQSKGAACIMSITTDQVVAAIKKGLDHGQRVSSGDDRLRPEHAAEHREAAE
jgi:FkbM family methyltransferase